MTKTIKQNYRVVVTPYRSTWDVEQGTTEEQRCEKIAKRIERNVSVSLVKSIEVIHDESKIEVPSAEDHLHYNLNIEATKLRGALRENFPVIDKWTDKEVVVLRNCLNGQLGAASNSKSESVMAYVTAGYEPTLTRSLPRSAAGTRAMIHKHIDAMTDDQVLQYEVVMMRL